ncbi:MAG: permease [Peptococcaceae bacterium]|jgi:uncharacterized membrane protein YraQ (UPF0718 family)|nr:permease [Peptococcaceae bacterium]MDH7525050.1 permease [Peptococcaceae bacterium]
MFTAFLYAAAAVFLVWSYARDSKKTKTALIKAWKAFANILPDFAVVLALIGIMLTYLSPETIAALIGQESGIAGMILSSLVGSATLIPGFVAFPLAASLLKQGAGVMQIAVFVSTLMMVGLVTAPLETKYFGRRETMIRNFYSFVFSFFVAAVIGVVVG